MTRRLVLHALLLSLISPSIPLPARGLDETPLTGSPPPGRSFPPSAILEAERSWMEADPAGAIRAYREALLSLAETPVPERSPAWAGEAELALRRLYQIAGEAAALPSARPAFERWMGEGAARDAELAALARNLAGLAILRGGGSLEEARRTWGPLGFLAGWSVVGPFENERGGGFGTELGPEKDQAAAAGAGRLFLPDPSGSYPGKVRPVSWRKLPAAPIDGWVDLDALFRPNDEVLAYALTHVESEDEQPAALRIGSDEGVKAWVNGSLVLSRDVRRPCAFDQDAAGIRLRKGWNSILLKVTEGKGPWQFQARLSRPDGAPLPGMREGEPPAGAAGGGGGPPRDPRDAAGAAVASLGARDLLLEAVAGGGREHLDRLHYLLGSILFLVHGHDEGEHPDRENLKEAISLSHGPAPAAWHYALALSSRRERAISTDRDDNDWREALEAARASRPPSFRAALDLADHYLETFGNPLQAEKLLAGVLAERPDLPEGILLRSRIEERRGFPAARSIALERCGKPFRGAGELPEALDPDLARDTAARLRGEGRAEEAGRLLGALISRDRLDSRSRRFLEEVFLARGRPEEALSLLSERSRIAPFDSWPHLERARVLEGLDRTAEALPALEEALRIAPEDAEVLRLHGAVLRRLGRGEEALRSWEKALSVQPSFPALREYVEFLKIRRDEFAGRWRRDAAPAISAALEAPAGGDDPVQVILDLTAVKLNPGGTVKEFRQYVARAMNDQGIRALARHSTPYADGEQRVEFEAARVHRKGGAVEEARLTVHEGDGEGGWREASIDLPPVSVGDVVEVQHVTEDLRPSFFGDYFGRKVLFKGSYPFREKTFILEAPADRRLHFHQRNLELVPVESRDDSAGTVAYSFSRKDVEAERPEPGMPPLDEVDPLVEVSTFGSWDAFSSWYWNLIRRQLELSPPISAKVAELTSGAKGDEEKVRAIYDFVTAEVRYNAWEFGVHGFKPYNVAAIFERRFGDCKDKAALLSTMLGAAGIRAWPVLIRAAPRARGDEDLTIPMVDHFNHCIAYVPPSGGRPGRFLDGTAEHNAVDELPAMDRGAKVLVVKDDGGEILQVPWNAPEELGLDEEIQASLDPDGSALVQVRHRSRGDYAAEIRKFFEVAGQRKRELEKIYGARFAGAAVQAEQFSDLADRSKPAEFQLTLRAPTFVQSAPEGGILPALEDFFETAGDFGALGALEKRHHELVLGPPRRSRLSTVLLLPPGFAVRDLPLDREISGRFGKLSLRFVRTRDGDREKVASTRVLETTAPRVSLADYPEFRELAAAVARLKDEKIVIGRSK